MCARNIYGGAINPDMPMSELTLANIKKILVPEFVAHMKRIYACGNYGDPIVARDCLGYSSKYRNSHHRVRILQRVIIISHIGIIK